jgi:hypothetical protein
VSTCASATALNVVEIETRSGYRQSESRRPRTITEQDLALCLFCLERVLTFWIDAVAERRPLA